MSITYTDNFFKENLMYIATWSLRMSIPVFASGYIAYCLCKSGAATNGVLISLLLFICLCLIVVLVNIINWLKLPRLKVDTDKFLFSYAEKSYDFDMLLPYYNVKKLHFEKIFFFSLHFKNGTSLELKLPGRVGLAFAKKYLNKYSRPDASLTFFH